MAAQHMFWSFKQSVLNIHLLGLTLHPVFPSPIVKLLLLMSIAYVVGNILSSFFSLDGVLCVVIISCAAQVQSASCALPPCPSPKRGFDYSLNAGIFCIPKLVGMKCLILQCNVFQN